MSPPSNTPQPSSQISTQLPEKRVKKGPVSGRSIGRSLNLIAGSHRHMQARKAVSQRESLNGLTSCHHKRHRYGCNWCGIVQSANLYLLQDNDVHHYW